MREGGGGEKRRAHWEPVGPYSSPVLLLPHVSYTLSRRGLLVSGENAFSTSQNSPIDVREQRESGSSVDFVRFL